MQTETLPPAALVEVVLVQVGAPGAARLAVPMDVVGEVGRPPGLTRVPGLPAWVAGVANWRGRVLAVVDLLPLLGGGDALPGGRRGRLVVVTSDGVTVGLLVAAVDGTVLVDPDTVEPPLAHLAGSAGSLLAGQVTDEDGPFGLLDVAALFALAGTLPRPRRAS
ncbi:MAG: CheW protein [Frankiales bacterium]|nr:CheW protein [Frankiales bacterium]